MIVVMKINYLRLRELALPLMLISIICLILVITPLGIETKGSSRWLGVGIIGFAPSELAKLAMVMFLARTMDINLGKMKDFWRYFSHLFDNRNELFRRISRSQDLVEYQKIINELL